MLTLLLALQPDALALEDDYDFDLEGYYRMRGHSFHNLYNGQEEPGRYITHRLRLQPTLNFEDRAKFAFMGDVYDNVVFGDNQSLASTALFAGQPSLTGAGGAPEANIDVKRAWMEVNVAIGTLRVGRQPSHWGLGLLANGGDGFDDAFGENYEGNNFDRILFATKPIAVAQTLMGRRVKDIPFYVGYAFDRLVEDPLIQHYGFSCDADVYDGEEGYVEECDTNADGKVDSLEAHGYTNDLRTEESRERDWTFDNADDVNEHVMLAIYRGENIPLGSSAADLTVGFYAINRNQEETASKVMIYDAYVNLLWNSLYVEGEVLNITGESSAIALPGAYDPASENPDPLRKDVDIWGYVLRTGYKTSDFSAVLETGYAGGDDNVADDMFTGRPLHPDYNVGLLIYDEILAAATAAAWGDSADALWSGGGVYNSRYIFPVVQYSLISNWEVYAGYLHVWPDKPDGAIIQCSESDGVECALYEATADDIGWEVDFAFKNLMHKHVRFSVEGAYAQVSDRIKLENVGLHPDGKFFTLQTRLAYEF